MSQFEKYAAYYDLLYQDKDYSGEVRYVAGLLEKYSPGSRRVLELGSGTGKHASLLAGSGYQVHGVDVSERMLDIARNRMRSLPADTAARLEFHGGDARSYRTDRLFDAVISLFHVASYQVENKDLLSMFETAAVHLEDRGIFVFDCWYGPAVLTDRPTVKSIEIENDELRVRRHTTPSMHAESNIVDVNFNVEIADKRSSGIEKLDELHRMRYLFSPEVKHLLGLKGFEIEGTEQWMTGTKPGFDTWNVCYIARYDKSRHISSR